MMRARGSYFTISSGSGMNTGGYESLFMEEDMKKYIETYGVISVDICQVLKGNGVI
jgi:hypothetical protein